MSFSKIILGTVQFGLDYGINNSSGKPSDEQIKKILDYAGSSGIRILDTAEAYGDSQTRIGDYHKTSNVTFDIITKYTRSRNDLPDNLIDRVKNNLKQLGVKKLYCYMFHNFHDYSLLLTEFKDELTYLKSSGLVDRIGVSLHSNEEIERVILDPSIDLIQLPFNLLDNSYQRKEILQMAKRRGLEIHTRSVFLQGLFFKDSFEENMKLKILRDYLTPIFESIHSEERNDLALNYAYRKDFIDGILLGVDNVYQLKNNLEIIKSSNVINMTIFDEIDQIKVKETNLLNPVNWKK